MPCGQENIPENIKKALDGIPVIRSDSSTYHGPFKDEPAEDTNKPFVRDLRVDELEELIEKAMRRVLQGEDIKQEFARLQAEKKWHK